MSAKPLFHEKPTVAELRERMAPLVARLGYKFNTESDFVEAVLESEIEILDESGDLFCPCRLRTGDPKEDANIICPCIPHYSDQFAVLRKCWCGLFIREDVEDGADLLGVVDEPERGALVEVPVCRSEDLAAESLRHVKIGRSDIVLARTRAGVHSLSNVCRHAFGTLSDGFIDGTDIICPLHGWRYNVATGTTDHPNADVKTYPVTERDGFVFITVAVGGPR